MSDRSFPYLDLSSYYCNINDNFNCLSSNIQLFPSPSYRIIIFPLLDKLFNSINEYKKMADFCIKELNDEKEKWKIAYVDKIKLEKEKFELLEQNYKKEKEKWKDEIRKVELIKEKKQNNIKKWEEAMVQIKIKENVFKNIEKERDEQKLKMEEMEKDYKNTIEKLKETKTELEKERNMRIMAENKIEELIVMNEILRNPPFPEFLEEKLLKPANFQETKEKIEENKAERNEILQNSQLPEFLGEELLKPIGDKKNPSEEITNQIYSDVFKFPNSDTTKKEVSENYLQTEKIKKSGKRRAPNLDEEKEANDKLSSFESKESELFISQIGTKKEGSVQSKPSKLINDIPNFDQIVDQAIPNEIGDIQNEEKNSIKENNIKIEDISINSTDKNLKETDTEPKNGKEINIENNINELVVDEYLLNPPFPEFLGEKLVKPIDSEKMTETNEISQNPQLTEFLGENLLKPPDSKEAKEVEEKMTEANEILRNPLFPEMLGEKLLKPTQDQQNLNGANDRYTLKSVLDDSEISNDFETNRLPEENKGMENQISTPFSDNFKEKQINIESKEDFAQASSIKSLLFTNNDLKSSEITDEEETKRNGSKILSPERKEVEEMKKNEKEKEKENEKEDEDEEKNIYKIENHDILSSDKEFIQTSSSGENIKTIKKDEKTEETTSNIVHNEESHENVLKKPEKSVNEVGLIAHPFKPSEATKDEALADQKECSEEKLSMASDVNNTEFYSIIESGASKVLKLNTIPEENQDNTKFLSFELNESKLLASQIEEKKENPVESKLTNLLPDNLLFEQIDVQTVQQKIKQIENDESNKKKFNEFEVFLKENNPNFAAISNKETISSFSQKKSTDQEKLSEELVSNNIFAIRHVKQDGNNFYRAIGFLLLESSLTNKSTFDNLIKTLLQSKLNFIKCYIKNPKEESSQKLNEILDDRFFLENVFRLEIMKFYLFFNEEIKSTERLNKINDYLEQIMGKNIIFDMALIVYVRTRIIECISEEENKISESIRVFGQDADQFVIEKGKKTFNTSIILKILENDNQKIEKEKGERWILISKLNYYLIAYEKPQEEKTNSSKKEKKKKAKSKKKKK